MTINSKQVVGLKVFTLNTGRQVDTVDDVLFDPLSFRVAGLLTKPKGLFGQPRAIALTDIKHIGPDALIVEHEGRFKNLTDLPARMSRLHKRDTQLTKSRILSESGQVLGKVTDIIFDPQNGRISQFDLSKSTDGQHGVTGHFTPQQIVTVGEDATIVSGADTDKQPINFQPTPPQAEQPVAHAPQTSQPSSWQYYGMGQQPAQSGALGGEVQRDRQPAPGQPQGGVAVAERPEVHHPAPPPPPHPQAAPVTHSAPAKPAPPSLARQATPGPLDPVEILQRQQQVARAVGAYLTKNLVSPVDDSIIACRGQMVDYGLLDQAHQLGIDSQIFDHLSDAPIADALPLPPKMSPDAYQPTRTPADRESEMNRTVNQLAHHPEANRDQVNQPAAQRPLKPLRA